MENAVDIKCAEIGQPSLNSLVSNGFGNKPLFMSERWKLESLKHNPATSSDKSKYQGIRDSLVSIDSPEFISKDIKIKTIEKLKKSNRKRSKSLASLTGNDISLPNPDTFVHISGIKLEGKDPMIGKAIISGRPLVGSKCSKYIRKSSSVEVIPEENFSNPPRTANEHKQSLHVEKELPDSGTTKYLNMCTRYFDTLKYSTENGQILKGFKQSMKLPDVNTILQKLKHTQNNIQDNEYKELEIASTTEKDLENNDCSAIPAMVSELSALFQKPIFCKEINIGQVNHDKEAISPALMENHSVRKDTKNDNTQDSINNNSMDLQIRVAINSLTSSNESYLAIHKPKPPSPPSFNLYKPSKDYSLPKESSSQASFPPDKYIDYSSIDCSDKFGPSDSVISQVSEQPFRNLEPEHRREIYLKESNIISLKGRPPAPPKPPRLFINTTVIPTENTNNQGTSIAVPRLTNNSIEIIEQERNIYY